jgi:signal transduction histidine kinase
VKRVSRLILLGCCSIGLFPQAGAQAQREGLPWILDTLSRRNVRVGAPEMTWQAIDLNGDGTDELAVLLDHYTVQIHAFDGHRWQILKQHNLEGPASHRNFFRTCSCGDLDGDGWSELAIPRVDGDSLWIDIWGDGARRSLGPVLAEDTKKDGIYDARLLPLGMVHDGAAGEDLLIVLAIVGLDSGLRGVLAYSLEEQEERWRHETGPNPCTATARLIDLDGDGHREILFTMGASCNGRAAGVTDDDHAWVMALRPGGELMWFQRLGGGFHHPNWCEVLRPAADRCVVVTGTLNRQHSPERGERSELPPVSGDSLHVWDGRTGQRLQVLGIAEGLGSLVMIDDRHLAVGTQEGVLSVYPLSPAGRLLSPEARFRVDPAINLVLANDLNGNGAAELVGISRELGTRVVVLDGRFEMMADLELPPTARGVSLIPLARAGRPDLLLLGMEGHMMTLGLMRNLRIGSPAIANLNDGRESAVRRESGSDTGGGGMFGLPGGARSVGLLLAMGAGGVAWAWARRTRRAGPEGAPGLPAVSPARPAVLTGDLRRLRVALLMATQIGDHGHLAVTRVARRLIWLLEAIAQQEAPPAESLSRLQDTARDFTDITSPQIEQILALAAALQVETSVSEPVQAGRETLTTLCQALDRAGWTHEQILNALPGARAACEQIEGGLHRLRLDALHSVTQPLTREIESAVATARESAGAAAARITMEIAPEARACHVRAARGDLAVIMENLIANSVRAVAGRPDPWIRIRGWVEKRFAVVEVSDNGCGIPVEKQEEIFRAGISSRETGGTGLFASRRLLDDLGGSLRVKESRIDGGTTMELRLMIETSPAPAPETGPGAGEQAVAVSESGTHLGRL